MKKTLLALAVALCAQGFAAQASATVLDFEKLASADDNITVGASYVEQGYKFEDVTPVNGFATWGTSNYFFSGSTALMNNDYGFTRLTQVDGGVFALNSISLATMYPTVTPDGSDVTFTGIRSDHSIVTQTFHVGDAGQTTFTFASNFTNLAAVTWANDSNLHQFDNVNVAAVPEPESYAMFLAGLGLMSFVARRRRT